MSLSTICKQGFLFNFIALQKSIHKKLFKIFLTLLVKLTSCDDSLLEEAEFACVIITLG